MKKISELFNELGFNPEGSDEVKKAFVKNLIREAQRHEFDRKRTVPLKSHTKETLSKSEPEQLEFNLSEGNFVRTGSS